MVKQCFRKSPEKSEENTQAFVHHVFVSACGIMPVFVFSLMRSSQTYGQLHVFFFGELCANNVPSLRSTFSCFPRDEHVLT